MNMNDRLVEQEFMKIDFSKLDDIDDAELKKKIELLGEIGEKWCVQYLGKFLNSYKYYDEIQDNMWDHFHEWTVDALSNYDPKDIEQHVMDYLGKLDWEIPEWSCNSNMYFNIGTSYGAYQKAMDLAVMNKFSGVDNVLRKFLPALSWGYSGFGGAEAKWLVRLLGIYAFDDLIGYINWHHRKHSDCGQWVDNRVVEAIVLMGPDAIPLLTGHVYESYYSPNPGVLEALEKLGADPTDYINLSATDSSEGYYIDMKDLEFLKSRSLERMHEKFVNMLDYYMYEIDIRNIISKIGLTIDKMIMMRFLNEKRAVQGVCRYFQEYPTPEVIKPLAALLDLADIDGEAGFEIIKTLDNCQDPAIFDNILKWISTLSDIETAPYFLYKYLSRDSIVQSLENIASNYDDLKDPLDRYLNSDSENERMVAVLLIGLFSTHAVGLKRLQAAGFEKTIHELFKRKSSKEFLEDFDDTKRFRGLWIPWIKNIANDTVALNEKDAISELADEIRLSKTPFKIISEIKGSYDRTDARLKDAVLDSIRSILEDVRFNHYNELESALEQLKEIDFLVETPDFLDNLAEMLTDFSSLPQFDLRLEKVFQIFPNLADNKELHRIILWYIERSLDDWFLETLAHADSLLEMESIRDALEKREQDLVKLMEDKPINFPVILILTKALHKDYSRFIAEAIEKSENPLELIHVIKTEMNDALTTRQVQNAFLARSQYIVEKISNESIQLIDLIDIIHDIPKLGEEFRIRNSINEVVLKITKLYSKGITPLSYYPVSPEDLAQTLRRISETPGLCEYGPLKASIRELLALLKSI